MSKPKKILILKLSSMGDVILSTAVLGTRSLLEQEVHWAVSEEFSPLLIGHRSLKKIWAFNRRTGPMNWVRFCRLMFDQDFDEVWDMHRTLRTRIARILFHFWNLNRHRSFSWRTISKQRFRLYGYFLFKRLWPKALRPQPWVKRYALFAGGEGFERPDLRYLSHERIALPFQESYLCVMPSSKWPAKEWPIRDYISVIENDRRPVVILGAKDDEASALLEAGLIARNLPCFSGQGRWTLPEVATVLSHSKGLLSGDTGLAHLAEALGVPLVMVFGPTVPDMGFGPWSEKSRAIQSSSGCSPCGKDGRFCFRIPRFSCQNHVFSKDVEKALRSISGEK